MNPSMVAANRTARLVREASAPVWSSSTGDTPKWKREQEERAAFVAADPFALCECGDC